MRAIVFETITGKFLHELELKTWEYDSGILAPDATTITLPAYTPRARRIRVERFLVPFKHGVALVEDSLPGVFHVPVAGVIRDWERVTERDGLDYFKVNVYGLEAIFEHRYALKYPGWPLVDSKHKPLTTYDLTFKNVQYGTIMKRLVQGTFQWAGGALPVRFEPDRTGTREKTYKAIDGKPVREALDDLSQLEAGVEYDFTPYVDQNSLDVSFLLRTGTDQTRIITPNRHLLQIGGTSSFVGNLTRTITAPRLWSQSIYMGGKDSDKVIAARATTANLTNNGFPHMTEWDTTHVTVSRQQTLQAYATGSINNAAVQETWDFQLRATTIPTLRHGDEITFEFQNSTVIPDGTYTRRVLAIEHRSESQSWLTVKAVGNNYGEIPT